jgi:hypothetical protein
VGSATRVSAANAKSRDCCREHTAVWASIKDLKSARIVCREAPYSVIQRPYNSDNPTFAATIDLAAEHERFVLVNRPLNVGKLAVSAGADRHQRLVAEFRLSYLLVMRNLFLPEPRTSSIWMKTGGRSMQRNSGPERTRVHFQRLRSA